MGGDGCLTWGQRKPPEVQFNVAHQGFGSSTPGRDDLDIKCWHVFKAFPILFLLLFLYGQWTQNKQWYYEKKKKKKSASESSQ